MKINKIGLAISSLLLSNLLLAENNINTMDEEITTLSVKLTSNKIDFKSNKLGEETYSSGGVDISVGFMNTNKDRWNLGVNIMSEQTIKYSAFETATVSFIVPHISYDFIYTNLETDTSLIIGPEFQLLIGDYTENYLNTSNGNNISTNTTSISAGISLKLGFEQKISKDFAFEMSYSIGNTFSDNKYMETGVTSSFQAGLNYKF